LDVVDSLALAAAPYNGDHNPSLINSVLSTRGAADSAIWPGSRAQPDPEPVYAITMDGSFNNSQWGLAPGVAPTNYSVLTLVVDAATGTTVDANLRSSAVELPAGTVTQLPSIHQGVITGEVVLHKAKAAARRRGRWRAGMEVSAVGLRGHVFASEHLVGERRFRLVLADGSYSVRVGRGCSARYVRVTHTGASSVPIVCS
jgi:hypothetical protein